MRLTRTGEPFQAGDVVGQRGLLVIGPASWPTIERWDVDTKLLPGEYAAEFGWWTNKSGMRWQAIRILLTQEQYRLTYPEERRNQLKFLGQKARGRIYFHPSNFASQLEGCIAPGLKEIEDGVAESRRAMHQVFAALGGWEESKRLSLEVS